MIPSALEFLVPCGRILSSDPVADGMPVLTSVVYFVFWLYISNCCVVPDLLPAVLAPDLGVRFVSPLRS